MSAILTPRWNIRKVAEKHVYEPSEDTFLLIDAIEHDIDKLLQHKPSIILEVGSGSGVVIAALSSIFHNIAFCLALDINPDACSMTQDTAALNGVQVDIIRADLLHGLRQVCMIDVIVFNPPYVETESGDIGVDNISQAFAGGILGREVMDRIFPQLFPVLSDNGIFYLVVIENNIVQDILEKLKKYGFYGHIVQVRQIRGELLSVLRFSKKDMEHSVIAQIEALV